MNTFTYLTYLPSNLSVDLNTFFEAHPEERKYFDYYTFFLNILTISLRKTLNVEQIKGKYVKVNEWHCNLHSVFLHNAMGYRYNYIIKNLIDAGFVMRCNHYVPSKDGVRGISKAFWLAPKYATYYYQYLKSRQDIKINPPPKGSDIKPFGGMIAKPLTSKILLRRLYWCRCDKKLEDMEDAVVADCYENLEHFHIDEEKSEEVLDEMVNRGEINQRQKALEMMKIQRFADLDSPIAVYVKHDTFGRIHTNITNIKREVRESCLTCDGLPVGGVDIRSSQAAFICRIFHEWVNLANDPSYCTVSNFVEIVPFWNQYNSTFIAQELEEQYNKYTTILGESRMYEFFVDEISADPEYKLPVNRKDTKKEFLAMLFAPRYIPESKPLRKAVRRVWEKHFPLLLKCIDSMKKENYAALAHEMQRTESQFVFGRVIPTIKEEIGCPYCTVHDSIIVPSQYVERVKEIMDLELAALDIPTITKIEMDILLPSPAVELSHKIAEQMAIMKTQEDDWLLPVL